MLTEVSLHHFLHVILKYRRTFKLVELSSGVSRYYYVDDCHLIGAVDVVFGKFYYFLML